MLLLRLHPLVTASVPVVPAVVVLALVALVAEALAPAVAVVVPSDSAADWGSN